MSWGVLGVGRGSPFLVALLFLLNAQLCPGPADPLFPGLAACSQAVITWGCWHSRLGGPYSVNRGPRTAVLDFEKNLFRPCAGKRWGVLWAASRELRSRLFAQVLVENHLASAAAAGRSSARVSAAGEVSAHAAHAASHGTAAHGHTASHGTAHAAAHGSAHGSAHHAAAH